MPPRRIFLVGLSGSGKSTTGAILARRLGWEFADSDLEVERESGMTVGRIFETEGEEGFRKREAEVLATLARREPLVVATGGGAPTTPEARESLGHGFVVWLSIAPAEAARRVTSAPQVVDRPLLMGDTRARLEALLQARASIYRGADAAVDVTGMDPDEAASELERLWEEWRRDPVPPGERYFGRGRAAPVSPTGALPETAAVVRAASATYPVLVGEGSLDSIGATARALGLQGRAFVVTDDAVGPLFAARALRSLESAAYSPLEFRVSAGEQHKTLATVSQVYDFLIGNRVERSDFVVCLGGGVVTDLAGFAAATCLRGIAFMHVPTSLLAMADAAIGGKTGVDHPRGKNLIGAFAQPRAVVIDPALLRSLPERHLRNGWAELLKHGLILDERLVADLELAALGGSPPMMDAGLISRSVAIKAEIVSEDEREAGRRTLLNYGHTIAHAIEAVTGYESILHGEAVAVGMRAAGIIAVEMGILPAEDLTRQQRLLRTFGLPESAPGLPVDAVLEATRGDKKVRSGAVRWVLLEGIGHATTSDDVPDELVRHAAETVLA